MKLFLLTFPNISHALRRDDKKSAKLVLVGNLKEVVTVPLVAGWGLVLKRTWLSLSLCLFLFVVVFLCICHSLSLSFSVSAHLQAESNHVLS